MPTAQRNVFPVLCGVAIALTAFAVIKKVLTPYEKLPADNDLARDSAPFLLDGSDEPIKWHRLNLEALALAKRQQRPIFLALGDGWNRTQRYFDKSIFTDSQTARLLASDFISIRVDLDAQPSWINSFLPYMRTNTGINPRFQLLVLSPNGKLVASLGTPGLAYLPDTNEFDAELIRALSEYNQDEEALVKKIAPRHPLGFEQANDTLLADSNQPTAIQMDSQRQILQQMIDSAGFQGFLLYRSLPLEPQTYAYIEEMIGPDDGQEAVDQMILSPCVDWLRGGFFSGSSTRNWMTPDYDKSAVLQAEMAVDLARLAILNDNLFDRMLATQTAKCLFKQVQNASQLIPVATVGSENGPFGRSPNSSASPALLRKIFPHYKDRKWAWNHLNLRVASNPLMTPYVSSELNFKPRDPQLKSHLKSLAKALPTPKPLDFVSLNEVATVDARLFQTGQILDDQGIIDQAASLFFDLQQFTNGANVVHTILDREYEKPSLCDYLCYADAALQDYRNFGNINSLNSGFAILNRGLFLFEAPNHYSFYAGLNDRLRQEIPDTLNPELVDDLGESDMAKVVRLCSQYGDLLQKSPEASKSKNAIVLKEIAEEAASRYAELCETLMPSTSGFLRAAAMNQARTFCLAIGPNSSEMAMKLIHKGVAMPVFPATGGVWPQLQSSKPGYYIIHDGTPIGPLSIKNAFISLGGVMIP